MGADEWDDQERADEGREVRASTTVAGYGVLVLIALSASVLTLAAIRLWPSMTGPSSVLAEQIQIGTVCPDITGTQP